MSGVIYLIITTCRKKDSYEDEVVVPSTTLYTSTGDTSESHSRFTIADLNPDEKGMCTGIPVSVLVTNLRHISLANLDESEYVMAEIASSRSKSVDIANLDYDEYNPNNTLFDSNVDMQDTLRSTLRVVNTEEEDTSRAK